MNIRRKDDLEFEIGRRQLVMKPLWNSWFHRVNKVANIYGLPNCYTVFYEYSWAKQNWKEIVKLSINDHLESHWRGEICRLDSLNMINPLAIQVGKPHPIWETTRFSRQATKKAISKVRMLTDTMMNGEKELLMFNTSSKCQCSHPLENRFHLILDCPIYEDIRTYCISIMIKLITENHPEIPETQIWDRTTLGYLILDPSWFRSDIGFSQFTLSNVLSIDEANILEHYGRKFCYQYTKEEEKCWQIKMMIARQKRKMKICTVCMIPQMIYLHQKSSTF